MTLPRKALRDAAKAALATITGLTVTGPRAFAHSVAALPVAEVYVADEQKARASMTGDVVRTIELIVVLRAAGADVDDVLDALSEQVEARLVADAAIGALVGDTDHFEAVAASFEEVKDGAEKPVASLTLMFMAEIHDED